MLTATFWLSLSRIIYYGVLFYVSEFYENGFLFQCEDDKNAFFETALIAIS